MDAKGAKAARIAARQHGVISTAQLRDSGVSRDSVRRRVEAGELHRLHRGVYAVGHPAPSAEGHWLAAILASRRAGRTGDARRAILDRWGAALSHRSAAALWRLLPVDDRPVDVSVVGDGGKKRRNGIRVHRSVTLLSAHVTLRRGIPVTTPARTVADLRSVAAPYELRRAIRQAGVLGLPLDSEFAGDRTRSELERSFLRLCRRHRLPAPEVNVRIGPHLVDFLWREAKLVVETDGYRFHRGRAAFEDDRARDLVLRERGYEVIRLSYRQVIEGPERVAAVLKRRCGAP